MAYAIPNNAFPQIARPTRCSPSSMPPPGEAARRQPPASSSSAVVEAAAQTRAAVTEARHSSGTATQATSGFAAAAGDNPADAALVQRAMTGDVRAFGVLVERYQRPMAALVGRMMDSPDDVDDVLQELFVRAWKGLPRFRGDAQFSTWLYRIAVNTAIKHRSRQRNERTQSLSSEETLGHLEMQQAANGLDVGGGGTSGLDPLVATLRREQDDAVRQAVMQLPDKQRVVVVLHYFEGRTCEEISEIAECSIGTVWSRLHYACKRLRTILEPNAVAASLASG